MTNNLNINDFEIIKDSEMRLALFNYFNTKDLINKKALNQKNTYLSYFENIALKNLTRLDFCEIWDNLSLIPYRKEIFCSIHIEFLGFLLENNLYKGDDLEKLIHFTEYLNTIQANKKTHCENFFNKKISLDSMFVFSYARFIDKNTKKDNKEMLTTKLLICTNTENTFIVNLLRDFFNYKHDNSTKVWREGKDINFAVSFSQSDENIKNFSAISDFTYEVFKKQFEFYKDKPRQLKTLIRFYLYLSKISGCDNFFKPNDPIDTTMMMRTDFIPLFKEGFVLINYNPFEEVPIQDKWVLKPNGLENTSTQIKETSYIKIDFSNIKNETYKLFVKHFFWNSKVCLSHRRAQVATLTEFLNFLVDYKSKYINSKNNNIDFSSVTIVDIYSYRGFMETSGVSEIMIRQKSGRIKTFLDYCIDKKYLSVQNGAFEYLRFSGASSGKGGIDIPDNELVELEKKLRENSNDGIQESLYYIIFHLAIETEFRISQLVSLRISDITEGMKKNQFFIYSINKTSYGEKEMQAISPYAKRHLDTAIALTEDFRDEASLDDKDYIFLVKRNSLALKAISPISRSSFVRYFKKCCREIGIPEYTPSNLRDTHMTKAVEYGFKKNLSPMQMPILTNHVKTSTTNNHYVNYKVRTFAEATYGIIIGDVDIKGTILNTTAEEENFKKEDTVDNGCGFCKENACKIKSELGCPMCDGFVVTLDRIPFYEHRIKEIDTMIANETIAHEIEHLQTIKRLYVAYLERLYTLLEVEKK